MTNDAQDREAEIRANRFDPARPPESYYEREFGRASYVFKDYAAIPYLLDALGREREANRELREAVLADAFPVPHHQFDAEGLNTCYAEVFNDEIRCDCGAREANARLHALLHPEDADEGQHA